MPKLSQKQELRQQLTPKQILQASLLQLNLPLLEQRILHELEINPALEMTELTDDANAQESLDIEDTEEEKEKDEDVEFEYPKNFISNIQKKKPTGKSKEFLDDFKNAFVDWESDLSLLHIL